MADGDGPAGRPASVGRSIIARITERFRRAPAWLRAVILVSLPATAFGIFLRFTALYDVFCRTPDELAEVMPGLRLHALPLFNVGDAVRYNFFRSMFYSQHGLGDVSFYYLASSALSLLGLPVSERLLFVAGGVTNLGLALAGGYLCARLLGKAGMGWVFAILVLVSPFYVFVSRTGWARLTWTPLLLLVLFFCQWRAMGERSAPWLLGFCLLAGFVSLTDGFVVFPILPVLGLLLKEGSLTGRLRSLARDRVFLAGFGCFAAGVGVDLLIGLGAARRGTNLTMMGYVLLRGGHGPLLPSPDLLSTWTRGVDWFFPFRGAWVVVTAAFALAAADGVRGRLIGFVAAWWLLASVALIRYAAGLKGAGIVPPVPSRLNAYHLAPPTLLLVAWLIASIADGHLAGARRLRPAVRGAVAVGLLLLLAALSAREARATALDADVATTERARLSACRTVKAAAYYVRSRGNGSTYVFHLSSDVFLGHFGEFYYGLSYGRSSRPEDPNRLLDFGLEQFLRRYAPEAFHRAYGVRRFDYYVDFLDDHDPFKLPVVERLVGDGARVVCTIRDGGRPIGRILSFSNDPPIDLDYRTAARAWDDTFARPGTLLQQPLAGTAYHFGYNWRRPE